LQEQVASLQRVAGVFIDARGFIFFRQRQRLVEDAHEVQQHLISHLDPFHL
jgi:hypothetical protein